jgi:hypothetical protein
MFSASASLRAACVAVLTVLAAPALADGGTVEINWSKDNPLIVKSNGKNYTKVHAVIGDFVLRGRLTFSVGGVGGVKSWSAWPVITSGHGIYQEVPGLKSYKMSKSYGVGSRPDKLDKQLEFSIPYSVIDDLAISMCEWKANSLRNQGKSDKQIFAKDHDVSFDIWADADVNSVGAGSNNQIWEARPHLNLPIRCAKWEGVQIPQGGNGTLAEAFRVLSATMKLQEETNAGGLCRVKTVTALRANKAGETIKYRFFHSSGKKSAVFEVKTEANKIAVINKTWDVPNGPGAESGWFWIEGVGTSFKTNKATYGMNCAASAPGGLVLGG